MLRVKKNKKIVDNKKKIVLYRCFVQTDLAFWEPESAIFSQSGQV